LPGRGDRPVRGVLKTRLAGLLKQKYPPEVVFLTAEILLKNGDGPYLTDWLGKPGLEQLRDDLEEIDRVVHRLQIERLYGVGGQPAGCDLSQYLVNVLGGGLGPFMPGCGGDEVTEGRWYDGTPLDTHYRTEIMLPWVARRVNRWFKELKRLPSQEPWDVLEHYEPLRKMAEHVGDVSDYLQANRIDAAKLTFNQLLHRSRRWHAAMRRQEALETMPPSPIVFSEHGYDVYLLDTLRALRWEGSFMRTCVADYWEDVEAGRSEIFSVREQGIPAATIEVRVRRGARRREDDPAHRRALRRPGAHGLEVDDALFDVALVAGPWFQWDRGEAVQIQGQRNQDVNKAPLCHVIQDFLTHFGFHNSTRACRLTQGSTGQEHLDYLARQDLLEYVRPHEVLTPTQVAHLPGWKAGTPTWRLEYAE
jgi:hypothetical protein